MLDDDDKKKIRSLDCYSIYGCLSPSLALARSLLHLLNYSWRARARDDKVQARSQVERREEAEVEKKNEISINPSFKLPHYNNFIFPPRFSFSTLAILLVIPFAI